MRESVVESHLVKRVEETGGLCRKVQWIGRRGAPDRLVGWPATYNGQFFREHNDGSASPISRGAVNALIETKRPAKGAEAHQAREHERLRAIGFDVRVLDTIEKVDDFIKEMTGK
jgi:hypothetical protein